MAKFWVLYLSLAGIKKLENGMSDISAYVEDVEENRKILTNFLSKPTKQIKEVDMQIEEVES